MFMQRLLVIVTIALCSTSLVYGQGRSGRDRGVGVGGSNRAASGSSNRSAVEVQKRLQTRLNQRAEQQNQRRLTEGANRAAQRRAVAASKAAHAAVRRNVREAETDKLGARRTENSRKIRRESLATKATEHQDVHAVIASGLTTGKPLHFSDDQRSFVKEVFGDAGLLEPRSENRIKSNVDQTNIAETDPKSNRKTTRPAPGEHANVRARLANAIRVRRAQISKLRDQAIDSSDPKLLERADRFEQKLDLFLQNQARVEASLAKTTMRSRDLNVTLLDATGSLTTDAAPRVAEAIAESGLIGESGSDLETRVE